MLGDAAGIRILPWKDLPAIRRVVQWHPRNHGDPINGWVRGHLTAIAAQDAERLRLRVHAGEP